MQSLSQQEQIVLNSIFLLGECRITYIRDFIRNTLPFTFSSKDLTTDMSEKLRILQLNGWVLQRGDIYKCTFRTNYQWLKSVVETQDFRAQVSQCNSIFLTRVFPQEKFGIVHHVFEMCAVVYLLQKDLKKALQMETEYKNWHKIHYYKKNPVMQYAVQYLLSYPDFFNELETYPEEIIAAVLPENILSSAVKGNRLFDWRTFYKKADIHNVKKIIPVLFCCAFLENDRNELAKLITFADYQDVSLGEAFEFALNGDWKNADQKFAHYLNAKSLKPDARDPSLILCVMLAFFPACAIHAAATRVKRWQEYLSFNGYEDTGKFFQLLYVSSERNIMPCDLDYCFASPLNSIIAIQIYAYNQKLTLGPEIIDIKIELAKKLLEKNQIILGIYLLNAAGTLLEPEDPRRTEITDLTQKYKVIPLYSMANKFVDWEKTLQAFAKLIPPSTEEKKAQKKEDTLSWMLYAKKCIMADGTERLQLDKIQPFFLHINRYGGAEIKEITCSRILNGSLDRFLQENELPLKGKIEKDYYSSSKIQLDALVYLEKSKSVFLNSTDHPITLIPEKNTILSKITKSGETELRLKYYPEYIYGMFAIYIDDSEDGVCRYCKLFAKDPFLPIFTVHGDKKGIIRIPGEAAKKFAETMTQISSLISFSGSLSEEVYRDLPKIEGCNDLHVLIYRDHETFRFEFRVKPSPETNLFFKPGIGSTQKIVSVSGKDFLLTRHLQSETKKFHQTVQKCPAVEKSVLTKYSAEAEDPEQILNMLSEMKEAGIILDWNSETPLSVSSKLDFSNLHFSQSSGIDWLSVGGELQISPDKTIALSDLLNVLEKRTGCFVELDEHSYLQMTRDLLKKLDALKAAGNINAGQLKISPASLPMLSNVFETGLPEKLQEGIEKIKCAFQKEIKLPSNLHGSLRPYQEDGFRYLARLADCRIGSCLADDMGLGKTVQLLALLLREAGKGPALVVVPASLCKNWEREAQKFAPSLHARILSTVEREKTVQTAGKYDLLICSYGILQSEEKLFASKKWHIVILDEAQAIKNDSAKRTKAVKTLQSDIRIVSTGTPVENSLMELWSLFDFLNPGLLGNANVFEEKFCINGMPRPALKKLVSPLILRRKKEEVLDDLPPKTEITIPFELPEEEQTMYEALRQKALAELQDQEVSHITILAQLTKLRRFCCDPSLVWKNHATGTKLQRILELAEELKTAGHRALIFSQYVDFLQIIRQAFAEKGFSYQYLDGACSQTVRMKSVDDFQNGSGDFFLISLKAGGTGLNLTAANYVILTDPWWNPAVENQAADRVHRIGQHEPVTVYRLITEHTVEERVLELHARKKEVSEDILSDTGNTKLSVDDLMTLFNP